MIGYGLNVHSFVPAYPGATGLVRVPRVSFRFAGRHAVAAPRSEPCPDIRPAASGIIRSGSFASAPALSKRDYITHSGWQRLRDELDHLWRVRRPAVTRALADAAAEGDRSENAEYIYRKKELREIDRRVRYLSRRVDELTVVRDRPDDPNRVFFGAWVELVDEDDRAHRHRIVGSDETDAKAGWISLHSPVARAVLGRQVGDEVLVQRPAGADYCEIRAIHYE